MALTVPDRQLPYIANQKEPALTMQELSDRYPDGGEMGWYAYVQEKKGFAFWDIDTETWI